MSYWWGLPSSRLDYHRVTSSVHPNIQLLGNITLSSDTSDWSVGWVRGILAIDMMGIRLAIVMQPLFKRMTGTKTRSFWSVHVVAAFWENVSDCDLWQILSAKYTDLKSIAYVDSLGKHIYHHLPSATIIYHHLPSSTINYHQLPLSITFLQHLETWDICNENLSFFAVLQVWGWASLMKTPSRCVETKQEVKSCCCSMENMSLGFQKHYIIYKYYIYICKLVAEDTTNQAIWPCQENQCRMNPVKPSGWWPCRSKWNELVSHTKRMRSWCFDSPLKAPSPILQRDPLPSHHGLNQRAPWRLYVIHPNCMIHTEVTSRHRYLAIHTP